MDEPTGGDAGDRWDMWEMEHLDVENREDGYSENLDLKTRERWTQFYNNTSQILNQLLKDRQMRDWEKRLREIEKYRGIPGRTGRPQMVPPEPETAKPEK